MCADLVWLEILGSGLL